MKENLKNEILNNTSMKKSFDPKLIKSAISFNTVIANSFTDNFNAAQITNNLNSINSELKISKNPSDNYNFNKLTNTNDKSTINDPIHNNVCNHSSCIQSSFRGLRNGIYYGAKVRFVHSLVMTLVFKNGSLEDKIKNIFSLTYEHSKNLGIYVFIYKSACCILRKILNKDHHWIPFIAGIIGSLVMWSSNTPVNQQLMLYLLSRNLLACTYFIQDKINTIIPQGKTFPVASVLCWGVVMYLYENYPKNLQNSLFSSMNFLYNESNHTRSWKDYVPFYIGD